MTLHVLENDELTLKIHETGAELTAIFDKVSGQDYLWNADPAYWKRSSPVLFPFVGSLKDKSYNYKGIAYPMSQHGFARDMDFHVSDATENSITFSLESTEATLKVYPFPFILNIKYTLTAREIEVAWEVINNGKDTMYFSIGAHPAFFCPLNKEDRQEDYYFSFDQKAPFLVTKINEFGLTVTAEEPGLLTTEQGILPIRSKLFKDDALIIENNQSHRVSLLKPDKTPYVTVAFDAPLFGLWSPAGKNAPFVCIEPWYGRCDSDNFNGSLEERKWGNKLEVSKSFNASYTITIE
ncbi:aldose 1-epimerase family protein [Anaerocolumna sp. AGMB13020]|uniref:aldose 1-epimerase family protein n=1 Tax=Anaerocolumna sp. AGMB13020 TaxID=3081750 RepID=UPI0029556E9E|nr:aldose 1-epimerase family protein [Anaerocolumna sp. AGMB13020]WOO37326.1 aldose 1-epimerase family protein [Anaerocolumna sp. AGMB13020]